MKVVVTCQPAIGHFHAVAPTAMAVARAGHQVLVLTGRGMGRWVRGSGLDVLEVGPQWLAEGPRSTAFDDPRKRLRLMSMGTAALLPGLIDALRAVAPDVLLHESLEWAGPLAADVVDLPFASLGQLPRLPPPLLADVLSGPWNTARSTLGLSVDPTLQRLCPYLYLDAYLPSMQPLTDDPLLWFGARAQDDLAHPIRPPLYQVGAEEPPAWLATLDDRPTVYVTMGTAFNRDHELFGTVATALRGADLNVIITVGRGVDPAGLAGDNVRVEQYVAQSLVLSRADLVVHHGGYLTTVGALAHDLPMVLLPVAVDQPYHAHRLQAAGVGIRLDPRTLRADVLRSAVDQVLQDPLYRRNAARLRREMMALPPEEHAVDLLCRLATTGEPVYRELHSPVVAAEDARDSSCPRTQRQSGRPRDCRSSAYC